MTTAVAYQNSIIPEVKITVISAAPVTCITASVPQIDLSSSVYTNERFYADLKNCNEIRHQMIAEALEEDAGGETLEFPM